MLSSYVIGVDFGTDSVRSILVDTQNGKVLATSVFVYPRWKQGLYCDPSKNQYRQDLRDHLEGLESTIRQVVQSAGVPIDAIKGIGVDTTGSSPMALTDEGIPLSFLEEFRDNPNAQVILWKDHTSIKEAQEITALAKKWGGVDFTSFSGGIYSSEWFWAKILRVYRTDPQLETINPNWMEHCDYIAGELTGELHYKKIKRSRCAAGHKAMWNQSWGGFPAEDFLSELRPSLALIKRKLDAQTYTAVESLGTLCSEWAERLGLSTATYVSVGTLDAHAGAAGAGIQDGALVKVMGTSTCDMLVAPKAEGEDRLINGISGQVDGSIVPGMIGFEAGQAGFGDFLGWFKSLVTRPILELMHGSDILSSELKEEFSKEIEDRIWGILSEKAQHSKASNPKSHELVIDWINGRRSPDVNESMKAAIAGIGMGTGVGELYRSLVEALCFGSKRIVERFQDHGVTIQEIVGVGGIAKKSPFLVQAMADILELPIKVVDSDQTPALGAAIYASVACGIHSDFEEACQLIASQSSVTYFPDPEYRSLYRQKYEAYKKLGGFLEFGQAGKDS